MKNKGNNKEKGLFDIFLTTFLVQAEGGYVNDPDDPGGATNKGITQATYNKYREDLGLEHKNVRYITDHEIKEIYYLYYWIKGECDKLPATISVAHFDACVNTGIEQAAKFIQRAAGVVDDGIIGPKTLKAIREYEPKMSLLHHTIEQREKFYKLISKQKPVLKKFLNGWLNRTKNLRSWIQNNIHDFIED